MSIPANPIDPDWTILKVLQWTTRYFSSHPIDSPRLTAEILLAHALGVRRIDLYTRFDQPLAKNELAGFKAFIKRRLNREPVAYITGSREFFGLEMAVSRDVLIPRPETEFLVEAALSRLPLSPSTPLRALEVGAGSGAVVTALAVNRPGHVYAASDISLPALQLAFKNAKRHGVGESIAFFAADGFSCLNPGAPPFDLILSNPPYIATSRLAELEPEVRAFEPEAALDGGPDGLRMIRRLVLQAPNHLKAGAPLMLEIGFDQKASLTRLVAETHRYQGLEWIKDYGGHYRVAILYNK